MVSAAASADGRYDVLAAACPTRQIVDRIGDRWSLLVLYALEGGTLRFQELRRTVDGISQKMLTQTVRGLERDGLVERTVHAVIPPRVDYCLTPLGRGLSSRIAELRIWAYTHIDEVNDARTAFDERVGQPPPRR
ncbi:helix-turn-helix transcriptional regulator [Frankia sp. AgB1.9]|uniref:winged helix-turn-helix transcriptional regulator n=1 Tax=unclassified Frankia TaxID=2632575 RepID=UPI0019332901|nr:MULTISPECIES: helix-turn-helix domain-containing protein [unclassified Frankia]MBL7494003.1 helix-turn-helix transcriptional regulator [Frankia sp. AgW1.1]MBL7549263.1 helix-turn-helix transcriptional regulator [Frankia sp. AgB1.9]MBL7619479.1 helix-turn-helix transcriptional regulator [Frankia sp. AgB1.8]